MERNSGKPGMTLAEWCVLIVIVLVLGYILLPIFNRHRCDRGSGSQCTSKLRQLAMAVTMYCEDHHGQYPGMNEHGGWAKEVIEYVKGGDTSTTTQNEMYFCPEIDTKTIDTLLPISYGYNAQLLDTHGAGVTGKQVKSPTQVGVLCDVDPGMLFKKGGGIVGGYGLAVGSVQEQATTVMPSPRHNKGCIAGYADGHAAIVPDKFDIKDCTNGITRAFFCASALGLVDNPTAGMPDFTVKHACATPVVIGGDPCVAPILTAACEAWQVKAKGFKFAGEGFQGMAKAPHGKNYLWGNGSGKPVGPHAFAVARDAVVFIINNNCTIDERFIRRESKTGRRYVITESMLRTLFTAGTKALTKPYKYMVYGYSQGNGTRAYLDGMLGVKTPDSPIVPVTSDADMVDKVSADPLAIGYCSGAAADQKRVNILAIARNNGTAYFPNADGTQCYPAAPTWPFMRTLYVECGGDAWRAAGDGIANVMLAPTGAGAAAMRKGPLFQASYWTP